MSFIDARQLLVFPPGANSSDTEIIPGVHFNLTTLQYWNYSYYSNGTLSNGSSCFLIFPPYTPRLLQDGVFLNSSSCYSSINPIGPRAKVGLAFGIYFALSIVFTIANLHKHSRLFLPHEKRFRVRSRRWQWYWMLAVAAFAIVSCFSGIDVDRYYLPELPMILSSVFYYLMLPCTLAIVWESVRHWSSWQERQMVDSNPFVLKQDDRRSKVEFWLPLVFYFFSSVSFFMIVLRPWTSIQKQRDLDQAHLNAAPAATDIPFKLAAFFNLLAWLIVLFSVFHSLKNYKYLPPSSTNSTDLITSHALKSLKQTPLKFILTLPLSLLLIAYEITCAFVFSISPLRYNNPNLSVIYPVGWLPIALIFLVYEIFGHIDPNEDRELIRQRRIRGAGIGRHMGSTPRSSWWTRHLDHEKGSMSTGDPIGRNMDEIGGGKATGKKLQRRFKMRDLAAARDHEADGMELDMNAVRAAGELMITAKQPETEILPGMQERSTDQPDRRVESLTTDNDDRQHPERHGLNRLGGG